MPENLYPNNCAWKGVDMNGILCEEEVLLAVLRLMPQDYTNIVDEEEEV
jgi:hypothetical protein